MRITGGREKGRILASPRGPYIRPTSDQVREAIFNILGQDLSETRVLDLFSGTGSLGLEALSRGAVCVVFIDNARHAVSLIRKNLSLCGYRDSGVVLQWDLRSGLPFKHPAVSGGFGLVFLDPPYGKDLIPPLLLALSAERTLSPGSHVVAETRKTENLPGASGDLQLVDVRSYGDTKIHIYTKEVNDGS